MLYASERPVHTVYHSVSERTDWRIAFKTQHYSLVNIRVGKGVNTHLHRDPLRRSYHTGRGLTLPPVKGHYNPVGNVCVREMKGKQEHLTAQKKETALQHGFFLYIYSRARSVSLRGELISFTFRCWNTLIQIPTFTLTCFCIRTLNDCGSNH